MIVMLGDFGETYATVVCRPDADGTLSVACNGAAHAGDTVAVASNDRVGKVRVTGLAAGLTYPYSVMLDGATIFSGTLRTAVPAGQSFNFMWMSCVEFDVANKYGFFPGIRKIIQQWNPLVCFHIGDIFYADRDIDFAARYQNWGGENPDPTSVANTAAGDPTNAYAWWRLTLQQPDYKYLIEHVPVFWMPDDHDNGINDMSTYANRGAMAGNSTEDAEYAPRLQRICDCYRAFHDKAYRLAYGMGKPENTDADVDTGLFSADYFRWSCGDAEFFVTDMISYRKDYDDEDDADKVMLGATQEAWLASKVAASVQPIKVVVNPKQFFTGDTGNADTYRSYTTERQRVIDALSVIHTVVVCSGDQHMWSANLATPDLGYDGYLLDVTACPIAATPFAPAATAETIGKSSGATNGRYYDKYANVGVGTVSPEGITLRIVSLAGSEMWETFIPAGQNNPGNRPLRLAIG